MYLHSLVDIIYIYHIILYLGIVDRKNKIRLPWHSVQQQTTWATFVCSVKNPRHKYWVTTIENGETKAQIPSNYITCPEFFLDRWRGWWNETWSWTNWYHALFRNQFRCANSLMAFFQLSPIDIATGALNNRISSVIDWIFANMDRCLQYPEGNLKKQSWWRLLTQTWNPIGLFPNYMSGFATCSPLNITKTWLIAILKPLSGW